MGTKPKKVLITGGTGFIGKALCDRLLDEGYVIYVLTRKKNLIKKRTCEEKIYINSLSEIQNIHIHIVINLAGETIAKRWTANAKKSIFNSRILMTRDIISHMQSKHTRPELFISASAIGYYGNHPDKTFYEGDEVLQSDSDFASNLCRSWEDEASQALHLGVRTVFLRIGPVLEKDGGMLAKLLPSFYLGLGSQISDGKQWISWIDRADLIKLILFIINHPNLEGAINATSPNPVTNKEFSVALAKSLNRPLFLKLPGFIFRLLFGKMAEEIMIKGQKVWPAKALNYGFEFSYPTIEQSFKKIFNS